MITVTLILFAIGIVLLGCVLGVIFFAHDRTRGAFIGSITAILILLMLVAEPVLIDYFAQQPLITLLLRREVSTIPTATDSDYSYSKSSKSSIYLPVTWDELTEFLVDDHTNWNNYSLDYYTCMDYSITLVENSHKQAMKAWVVLTDFYNQENGHALVAFETTDLGVVFIEPQTDHRYTFTEVGKPLCDDWGEYGCLGTVSKVEYVQCNHQYECMKYTP